MPPRSYQGDEWMIPRLCRVVCDYLSLTPHRSHGIFSEVCCGSKAPRKRTWLSTVVMSALCQKQTSAILFDHLVSGREQLVRHGEADGPGSLGRRQLIMNPTPIAARHPRS